MSVKRIEILGVPVDCVDMRDAVAVVEQLIAGTQCSTVIAVNPEKVMRAQEDPELLDALRTAGLLIPDGIGIVWAARWLRLAKLHRVTGVDLMAAICEFAAQHRHAVYLFGATPDVNSQACETLRRRYAGLEIAGSSHGYVAPGDTAELIRTINASGARILFVGLGSPRQEHWMRRYAEQLEVRVCQGVGGTLDVIAGSVKRAPAFYRNHNLEWLFRLASQPSRIRRQSALPRFALRVLRQALGDLRAT